MTTDACLPCQEDEHDACHNLLWDAGCFCPHTNWPTPRCEIRGTDSNRSPTTRIICDLPRHHPGVHEGDHWVLTPPADEKTSRWWGWSPTPRRWGKRRVVAPPGRFDPFDPDAPSLYDQTSRHEDVA